MKNWLEIGTGVFLLGMVLYGHWKGLIRYTVSLLALVLTFGIVRLAMPFATDFLRENTPVYERLAERMGRVLQPEELGEAEGPGEADDPLLQRQFIEGLDLPEEVKALLIEDNNHEVYDLLGVNAFAEYVGNYLAGLILNGISFVVLFLAVYVGLRLLARALDLMARLPILSGMNQIAGAVLGGVYGLILVWLFFLLVTVFRKTGWASFLMDRIRESVWLSFLYRHNPVTRLVLGVFRGMIR